MGRFSGVLLHPTAFYGRYGCGDLGPDGFKILDWLHDAGQSVLQVLPLNPTGFGNSPYSSASAFAGNHHLISIDVLIKKGLLTVKDIAGYPLTAPDRVDFGVLNSVNNDLYRKAFKRFIKSGSKDYNQFKEENSYWLHNYALFVSLKKFMDEKSWNQWDSSYRDYSADIKDLPDQVKEDYEFNSFLQFEFFSQWSSFKSYANSLGISVFGDIPIFVSYDSADVWGDKDRFMLDKDGLPLTVAGVPPDYFSETGQLWGNPHYNWSKEESEDFGWWRNRIKHSLRFYDYLRIDHFRGFESYWAVPYGEKTAVNGKWVKSPGMKLFAALKKDLKSELKNRIIAEDLGVITAEVRELRDKFGLRGMRVFEFAPFNHGRFSDDDGVTHDNSDHPFLPANYDRNSIAYTGTHDNDTLIGWFNSLSGYNKSCFINYMGASNLDDLNFSVIKLIMSSDAYMTVFPLQDILGLDTDGRFNYPGSLSDLNWSWRLRSDMLTKSFAHKLKKITKESGRAR